MSQSQGSRRKQEESLSVSPAKRFPLKLQKDQISFKKPQGNVAKVQAYLDN
jgi:hypothetical protein